MSPSRLHAPFTETSELFDTHVHTELAYCANDTNVADCVAIAAKIGLDGLCFTEHAAQLYCTADQFWSRKFIFHPRLWRMGSRDRMDAYFRLTDPYRGPTIPVGLEAEIDCDGAITVRPEDRDRLDLLAGAIHWLPEDTAGLTDAQITQAFLRTTERLLAADVDILVHPMRLLDSLRPVPQEISVAVAEMLAATNTVAEINFHLNSPELSFVVACIERGVKLTFGSDAHSLCELGQFAPNLALLRKAAACQDVQHLLYKPSVKPRKNNHT